MFKGRAAAHILVLLAALAICLASCGQTRQMPSEAQPAPSQLTGDFRVHDPTMIKQGETYYVFSTGDERGLNHGTIQIRKSTDLATWKLVGTVFADIPAWIGTALGSTPPNLWAPDISYFNNSYHLYYAGSRFGSNKSVIGLATTTTLDPNDPAYGWKDEGQVIQSIQMDRWNAIDPNISFDTNNTPWLAFGSFWDGIKMRRIDPATGKLDANDPKLYDLASRGGGPIEAPAIVYRDGWYYLFTSFDACCRGTKSTYRIIVGRSQQITGPYVDRANKALLTGGGSEVLTTQGRIIGPGGQSILLDTGTYRLVHHYYDGTDKGVPKLQINDLSWTSDGWPQVATSK